MDNVRAKRAVHVHRLRVYYEDTDAAGVVYYANYLRFAERARTEMLRDRGFDQVQIRDDEDIVFAVRACHVDYLRPSRLDDELEIHTEVEKVGGASIGIVQIVKRGDEVITEMRVALVCIRHDGRPVRIPARVRSALADPISQLNEV